MDTRPIVATVIGDPCGVGPEICVKALATGEPHAGSRPVLVGSVEAVRMALESTSTGLGARRITDIGAAQYDPTVVDVLDPEPLAASDVTVGRPSGVCGGATVSWIRLADQLATDGQVAACVIAPISSEALKMMDPPMGVDDVQPPGTVMFRVSGGLRVLALSEHIPLRDVPDDVTCARIVEVVGIGAAAFGRWGVSDPHYAVAGLNAHAMGVEEEQIAEAIEVLRARGFHMTGPLAPDSVFRQCLEGQFDLVVSMYHDQGQIALKTAAFEGACTIYLGAPHLRLTIPHGTAFDIAGQGVAQHRSMLAAMNLAGQLAAGEGFSMTAP